MDARVRIGRVRLRSGGEVRLLHHDANPARSQTERDIRGTLDAQGEVAGYAFVVWDREGGSSCCYQTGAAIPTALIPDFVRNRLLLGIGCRWTLEDVNDAWGHPPSGGAF